MFRKFSEKYSSKAHENHNRNEARNSRGNGTHNIVSSENDEALKMPLIEIVDLHGQLSIVHPSPFRYTHLHIWTCFSSRHMAGFQDHADVEFTYSCLN